MSDSTPLFKVTFDESAIHTVFDSIEAHLKLHDEQIAELQRLLKECCTQKDLEQLRDDIKNDNEKQMKDLSDALTSKIDDNMKKQAEELADKLKEMNDQMKDEMNKISNDMESKVADTIQNKLDEDAAKKAAALEEEKAKQEEEKAKLEEEKAKLEEEKAKQEKEKNNQNQKNGEEGSEGNSANGANGTNGNDGENGENGEGDEDDDSNLTDAEKLQKTRKELKDLKKLVDENRNYIQTMANSYAAVNKTEAELGPSLQRTLDATSETISRNFKRIFDFIKSLSPNGDGSSVNRGQNGVNGSKNNNTIRGPNGLNGNGYPIDGPYPPEINISDLNFVCSEVPASFNEVPQLPQIYKFQTLPESVQYLYDSFPKLQGYLRAMHDKLGEVCTKLGMDDDNPNENDSTKGGSAFDPSAYDNLVASVRKALNEMSADIDELRRSKKGLSKQDVMEIIRSMMNQHDDFNSDETAVGYVRCIACGREMRQVSGAMTEEQATRKLGYAANSLAVDRSGSSPMEKSIGQVYGNTQGDSKFIDSPRSIRPPKRKSGMSYKTTTPR